MLFQTSTLEALVSGVYEGEVTYDQLRKYGGHLLEIRVKNATIEIDTTSAFHMVPPKD